MSRKTRHIEIVPSKDEIFGGPEVHVIKFLYGDYGKEITLSTRELKELKQKIGVYLYTYNLEEPKQLKLF